MYLFSYLYLYLSTPLPYVSVVSLSVSWVYPPLMVMYMLNELEYDHHKITLNSDEIFPPLLYVSLVSLSVSQLEPPLIVTELYAAGHQVLLRL